MADARGPGLLYVNSKLTHPELLNEAGFLDWYDNDHIPEIMGGDGMHTAWRWKDVSANADKPYLTLYPMKDIAFLQTDEFKNISVHSPLLPKGMSAFDLAEFDVRYVKLVQVYDPTKKGTGHTKTVMAAHFELGPGLQPEELDQWYREEHLEQLSKVEGYLRTTRYKLTSAHSNAQPGHLKGFPDVASPPPGPPTWLALHEFSIDTVDMAKVRGATSSEWTKKVLENSKVAFFPTYRLAKAHGKGELFHGVEM